MKLSNADVCPESRHYIEPGVESDDDPEDPARELAKGLIENFKTMDDFENQAELKEYLKTYDQDEELAAGDGEDSDLKAKPIGQILKEKKMNVLYNGTTQKKKKEDRQEEIRADGELVRIVNGKIVKLSEEELRIEEKSRGLESLEQQSQYDAEMGMGLPIDADMFLSSPITDTHCRKGHNEVCSWASCAMQGWRKQMEDTHIACVLDLPSGGKATLFAIFDGHGGSDVSDLAQNHFRDVFVRQPDYLKSGNYAKALRSAFMDFDLEVKK